MPTLPMRQRVFGLVGMIPALGAGGPEFNSRNTPPIFSIFASSLPIIFYIFAMLPVLCIFSSCFLPFVQ